MSGKIVFAGASALAALLLANMASAEDAPATSQVTIAASQWPQLPSNEYELGALHLEDVMPKQAREIWRPNGVAYLTPDKSAGKGRIGSGIAILSRDRPSSFAWFDAAGRLSLQRLRHAIQRRQNG